MFERIHKPRTPASPARTRLPGASRGAPLSESARALFEPRLGIDFDGVRVHDDAAAHRFADGLDANACTLGRNIYFARGQYAPETAAGRRLLAHELTHVVQQRSWAGA